MPQPLPLLGAVLGLALSGSHIALAHGGAYRGPGDLVPRAVRVPPPDLPGFPPMRFGGMQLAPDRTLWQYWWEFNKDSFLARRTGDAQHGKPRARHALVDGQDRKRIVDVLTRILADPENSPAIHSASLMALAKASRKSAPLGTFRDFLAHPALEKSETAAIAMGVTGQQAGVTDLLALACDDPRGRTLSDRERVPFRTRAFACYALGLIARQSHDMALQGKILAAMKDLASQAQEVRSDIRVAALTALRLLHFDKSERGQRLRADTIAYLTAFVHKSRKEETGRVRAHAVTALATLAHRYGDAQGDSLRSLLQLIHERRADSYMQQSAALGLGILAKPGDAAVSEALRRHAIEGRDRQARYFSCISLGRMGGAKNQSFLSQPFLEPEARLPVQRQERPWRALGLVILESQARAADNKRSPDSTLAENLHKSFRDERSHRVAAGLALALGALRYEPAREDIAARLKRALPDDDPAGYLCLALALLQDKNAQGRIGSLIQAHPRRETLLVQGVLSLGLLEQKASLPLLIRMLRSKPMLVSVYSAVAMALSRVCDEETIDTLIQLAEDRSRQDLTRAYAVVTLGLLADEEPLPWNHAFLPGLNYRAMFETLSSEQRNGILDIL